MRCLRSFLLHLTCLALFCGSVLQLHADERPNVVYFLIDDLGYADCGFNGGSQIQTPSIDRLAREGAILKSFYVQPVCSPTRSSLMTGRYVSHTGVYNVVRPGAPWGLPLNERTLPQALSEAGYHTAICGKWHLGEFQPAYTPTHRGFARQYGHMFGAIDYFSHTRDGKRDWYRDDKELIEEGYSTHLVTNEACKIIREKPADKPLFLYVPFNGIHGPHQVPESYTQPYEKLPKLRRTIAGMLAVVDEGIGKIVKALEEKGIREKTLIIFSSDNGGPNPGKATMNTPLRAGKGTIYEGGIRACSFVNWPAKIKPGTTINEPLHAIDWYPTLISLCGASPVQTLKPDGVDIWPVLTQGAQVPRDALLLHGMRPGVAAIRMGQWKLLRSPTDQDTEEADSEKTKPKPTAKRIGKLELYDLANDLSESKDLAKEQPAKVAELQSRLDELLKDAVEPIYSP